MSSMWTAASDRDYYGPSEAEEREQEDGPWDHLTADEWSLYATEEGAI